MEGGISIVRFALGLGLQTKTLAKPLPFADRFGTREFSQNQTNFGRILALACIEVAP